MVKVTNLDTGASGVFKVEGEWSPTYYAQSVDPEELSEEPSP